MSKYESNRDDALHFLCTSGWANSSFGDVEAPVGYNWRITNAPVDVAEVNTEFNSLMEDWDGELTLEVRDSLVGHFLVVEDSNGLVHVLRYNSGAELIETFVLREDAFNSWNSGVENAAEKPIENALYFVSPHGSLENLETLVDSAEFISGNPASAFAHITENELGATHEVFKVSTVTNLLSIWTGDE